jgi:uncharacterized protein (DUF488 family)
MEIYTIGFTKRSARDFFETIKSHGIQRLLDVRLNNSSQLAGFSKKDDLEYFLRRICDVAYVHDPILAPTPELLDSYKKTKSSTWEKYATEFLRLMAARKIEEHLHPADFEVRTVLLCSEFEPQHCHRRLVLEYLRSHWGSMAITHL